MSEHDPRRQGKAAALRRPEPFSVTSVGETVGKGIRSNLRVERGEVVAGFSGELSSSVLQHSLQVSEHLHLHDPYFVGLLSHSCSPNCALDMQRLEILALRDIEPGALLTIDYAGTEDRLFKQFPCTCGSRDCRGWITGRREKVNEAGRAHLAQLERDKR